MPTSQGTGEKQTSDSTKDASYEINDGFAAAFNTHNNNIEIGKTTNHDEMSLKTTVVSLVGNGVGITEKPRRSGSTWLRPACVVFGIVAFLLLVAFITVLCLYIQERDDSSGLNNVCLQDNCIARAAGENKVVSLYLFM